MASGYDVLKIVSDSFGDELEVMMVVTMREVVVTPMEGTQSFLFNASNVQVLRDMIAVIEGGYVDD